MQVAYTVPAHDINRILSELVARDCEEIHVKLDIEGAEFEVVPRLLQWEHLGLLRSVRIEWHERFFGEERPAYKARRAELTKQLGASGITAIDHWCSAWVLGAVTGNPRQFPLPSRGRRDSISPFQLLVDARGVIYGVFVQPSESPHLAVQMNRQAARAHKLRL